MKLNKKIISVLLALVMIFAFSASALAASYPDIGSEPQKTQDAIEKLTGFGIFEGDQNGKFNPQATITRAEFAKVISHLEGRGASGPALQNQSTGYTDVKVGEWYTGWINLVTNDGAMKGYPDKTFRPNNNITENEVITVLLRTLGYDDRLPGTWPTNYVAKADSLGILTAAENAFTGNTPALRATVARMADYVLDQETVVYSKDISDFKGTGKTLFEENFKGAGQNGLVVANADKNNAIEGWKYNNNGKIELIYNIQKDANNKDITPAAAVLADTVRISGGYKIQDLAGQKINIVYRNIGGENRITFIDVVSNIEKTSSIAKATDTDKITVNGVTKTFSAEGKTFLEGLNDSPKNTVAKGIETVLTYPYAVVYYDANGQIYYVENADQWTTAYGLVKENNEGNLTYTKTSASPVANFKDKNVVVIRNGEFAKITDIAANDTVEVYANAVNKDYLILANALKDGKVTKGDGKGIYINDKFSPTAKAGLYTTDAFASVSKAITAAGLSNDNLLNVDMKYSLQSNNNPAYMLFGDAAKPVTVTGVITNVDISGVTDVINKVTIFNKDKETKTYDVDTTKVQEAYKKATSDYGTIGALVTATLDKDNKITKLDIKDARSATSSAINKAQSLVTIDTVNYKVTDNTAIFAVVYVDDATEPGRSQIKNIAVITKDAFLGKTSVNKAGFIADGATAQAITYIGTTATAEGQGFAKLKIRDQYLPGTTGKSATVVTAAGTDKVLAQNATFAGKPNDLIFYNAGDNTYESQLVVKTDGEINAITGLPDYVKLYSNNAAADTITNADKSTGSEVTTAYNNGAFEIKIGAGAKDRANIFTVASGDYKTLVYKIVGGTGDKVAREAKLEDIKTSESEKVFVFTSLDKDLANYASVVIIK